MVNDYEELDWQYGKRGVKEVEDGIEIRQKKSFITKIIIEWDKKDGGMLLLPEGQRANQMNKEKTRERRKNVY